ncbi:iron complex transport system permease protein [Amycolatopsis bartoniae]|uniref:ABC transporter permease n=1 Tax=Amycolatopsis bartoniae TaxID=941986 RepID=A0A8H9IWU4_9PSEU|nr:iron chelate uptake ABC transporter family permease subunit [Amycolatopsis bartoniae]MBB2933791.1 iron complex transport system permease protein [Amycolatopsis bartoniae]TVT10550.1 iron chelate uptake ABC transporter family permease subunit [Amycolatopsis bartoniae]GHF71698.1 ABC transporter permease [Amycolatopsis bartoniae]
MTAVLRAGPVSLRVHPRAVVVAVALLVATFAISVLALTTGDYPLSVPDVLKTLAGDGPPGADFVVTTLRLPRLLTGLFVGAALAVSGGILQSISGNALGSPDVIGFTQGSAVGAFFVILVLDGGMFATSVGALVGGLVTAAVLYLLSYRGGVLGLRLILMGIGVSALLLAVNSYLITRASLQDAIVAQSWRVGGLNGREWEHVTVSGVTVAVLLPVALLLGRRLSLLELGDDKARALGVRTEQTRLALLVVSVLLAAFAVAVAGPIAFLALAAPQVARRLSGSAGPALLTTALTGAFLLVASDFVVQRVFASRLPVGVVTGALGGLYLAWLLVHQWRRRV